MAWKINTATTGSLSDGATKLPVGTNRFKIVAAAQVPDKQDPKGKALQVVITLGLNDKTFKTFLSVESAKEVVAEIAQKTLRDFFVSAGITGQLSAASLPKLVGKSVEVTVVETAGKGDNAGKTYSNISSVDPCESVETPEEEEEEEETPAPAPVKKTKTAPAPEPEPEADDDDDSDDDDDADDTPPPAAKAGKKKNPWD